MDSLDDSVNEYLRFLRIIDSEAAARLENGIREHRARATAADFAAADLTIALLDATTDLSADRTAEEHLVAAIERSPIDGLPSAERLETARHLLAAQIDPEAVPDSDSPTRRLFLAMLQGPSGEQGHLEQIRLLRAAVRNARAVSRPQV